VLLAVVAVGGIAAALNWFDTPLFGAKSDNLEQISVGKTVYADSCASCHGVNLEGQANWRSRKDDGRLPAPPHDETGHTWHHPNDQLFKITKFGLNPPIAPQGYESDMPSFKDTLTDEQIWAVLEFIESTWSEETRERRALRGSAAKP